MRDATVTLVRWYSYTYCDLIQGQGQGHGAFELLKISEAMHAGGDGRQPP